jgi:predicted glycoside hydrolase/deacetylase ChbG (UPF0249 family)
MMNTSRRYLIVNADDFGLSRGVNRGIMQAVQRGIVTSASLMVRQPAAAEAVALARDCPQLGLGLHIDLGEWAYRDGAWQTVYEFVDNGKTDAVRQEVQEQFDRFCELTDQLPSHLDSHQHVHRQEPAASVMRALAKEHYLPLRHENPAVAYQGAFYGQAANGQPLPENITVDSLLRLLPELASGATELGCHPGFGDDLNTMYRLERKAEVQTLCEPQVRAAIDELRIELTNFKDLAERELIFDKLSPRPLPAEAAS